MRLSIPKFHCEIVFSQEDLGALNDFLNKNRGLYSSCLLLSDSSLPPSYAQAVLHDLQTQALPSHVLPLQGGENLKTIETADLCWKAMHRHRLDRKSLIISIGGGSLSDLAGFVAATYMRGIDVIHIPTTLLAMVDASIGGKTGINLPTGKNMVGAIHHPRLVAIAPHFLQSLPDREFRSGLAEVIKAGVIRDPELFEFLETQMQDILNKKPEKLKTLIARACKAKVEVVKLDEKEKGLRSILNYGHTFSHAIETITDYRKYTHGETVSIGMNCAAMVSRAMGFVDASFVQRQESLCHKAGLPTELPDDLDIETLIDTMYGDKKTVAGKLQLILPKKIGEVMKISDADPKTILKALGKKS